MKIAVFFVGEVQDDGFNASALAGAERAAQDGLAAITLVSGVRYDQDEIRARLAEVVPEVDGLVFIGGQGNIATPEIAARHPDKRFAIVQGQKTGANLASYDVRQEDSAFLAGVLAAHLSRTGIVGHLSGHRVRPGLKGRAAFVAGVAHADPKIKVLTGFCGTQDDSAVTRRWAEAEIAGGADVLFTRLNAARRGAVEACRAGRVWQIGNALERIEPVRAGQDGPVLALGLNVVIGRKVPDLIVQRLLAGDGCLLEIFALDVEDHGTALEVQKVRQNEAYPFAPARWRDHHCVWEAIWRGRHERRAGRR